MWALVPLMRFRRGVEYIFDQKSQTRRELNAFHFLKITLRNKFYKNLIKYILPLLKMCKHLRCLHIYEKNNTVVQRNFWD